VVWQATSKGLGSVCSSSLTSVLLKLDSALNKREWFDSLVVLRAAEDDNGLDGLDLWLRRYRKVGVISLYLTSLR
jgi:hypothetical protein